jgi:hypothetical protein
VDIDVEEHARNERRCECGCGVSWLVSRGWMHDRGETVSFVVQPTIHDDDRTAWIALGRGTEPAAWAFVRSWLQDESVAAGAVDRADSPLRNVEPFASRPDVVLSRAQVIGDAALKQRLFALHDALCARNDEIRALYNPIVGLDYSFRMPDCVFARPPAERSPRNQKNFAELGPRRFVRALFPIPVADGDELRLGIWLELSPVEFDALHAVRDDDEGYLAMRLSAVVETSIVVRGQQLRGTRLDLAPRAADQCLFVQGGDAPWLALLLRDPVPDVELPEMMRRIGASVNQRSPPS